MHVARASCCLTPERSLSQHQPATSKREYYASKKRALHEGMVDEKVQDGAA